MEDGVSKTTDKMFDPVFLSNSSNETGNRNISKASTSKTIYMISKSQKPIPTCSDTKSRMPCSTLENLPKVVQILPYSKLSFKKLEKLPRVVQISPCSKISASTLQALPRVVQIAPQIAPIKSEITEAKLNALKAEPNDEYHQVITTQNSADSVKLPISQDTTNLNQNAVKSRQNISQCSSDVASHLQSTIYFPQVLSFKTQNMPHSIEQTSRIIQREVIPSRSIPNTIQNSATLDQDTAGQKYNSVNPIALQEKSNLLTTAKNIVSDKCFLETASNSDPTLMPGSILNIAPNILPSKAATIFSKPRPSMSTIHENVADSSNMRISPLKCKFCGFQCENAEVLQLHLRHHQDEFMHQRCPHQRCKFRYITKASVISHYRQRHGEPSSLLFCSDCVFSAKKSSILVNHRKKHFQKRPVACILCFRTFVTLASCRCHYSKCHTDDKKIKQELSASHESSSGDDSVVELEEKLVTARQIRYSKRIKDQIENAQIVLEPEDDEESIIEEDLDVAEIMKENVIEEDMDDAEIMKENVIEEDMDDAEIMKENGIEEDVDVTEIMKENVIEEDIDDAEIMKENVIEGDIDDAEIMKENVIEEDMDDAEIMKENVIEEDMDDAEIMKEIRKDHDLGSAGDTPKTLQLVTSFVFLDCAFCQKNFNSKTDLANHLLALHGEEIIYVSDALIDV